MPLIPPWLQMLAALGGLIGGIVGAMSFILTQWRTNRVELEERLEKLDPTLDVLEQLVYEVTHRRLKAVTEMEADSLKTYLDYKAHLKSETTKLCHPYKHRLRNDIEPEYLPHNHKFLCQYYDDCTKALRSEWYACFLEYGHVCEKLYRPSPIRLNVIEAYCWVTGKPRPAWLRQVKESKDRES